MNCQNLAIKYQDLLNLQAKYNQINADFEKMKQNTPAQRDQVAKTLKDLQTEIQNLITTEFSQFLDFKFNETQKTLKEQYSSLKNIYKNNNLIQENETIKNPFPDLVEQGIQEYFPFPTEQQIRDELTKSEKREFYELKIKQDFTRIQITPIIPIDQITESLKSAVLKHKDNLFDAQVENSTAEKTTLDVDENQPVWRWDGYDNNADLNGDIIYHINKFPQKVDDGSGNKVLEPYDQNKHGGLTKKELLLQSLKTPFPGYIVELKQASPLIPRENQEANKSSEYYLNEIQGKKEYQGENLTTVDSEMIDAITNLEQNNGVIRDYQNQNDTACFAAGTYLKRHGYVSDFRWDRDNRKFYVYRASVGGSSSSDGGASSARLI